MANEKRLIDADAFESEIRKMFRPYGDGTYPGDYEAMIHDETLVDVLGTINEATTVDAVEVEDPELRKAIKLLIKQYDRSKASEYVHSPVAHALYHTWKQVDKER